MQNFKPRGNMHNNRVRYLYYPATEGAMIKVDIHFRDGGVNMWSYKNEKKGVEISISQVTIGASSGGMQFEQSSPMDGIGGRLLVLELGRYSAKKLEKVAEAFDDIAPRLSAEWLEDRDAMLELIQEVVDNKLAVMA